MLRGAGSTAVAEDAQQQLQLVTGDSNGTVYLWGAEGTVLNLIKHAHQVPYRYSITQYKYSCTVVVRVALDCVARSSELQLRPLRIGVCVCRLAGRRLVPRARTRRWHAAERRSRRSSALVAHLAVHDARRRMPRASRVVYEY